MLICPGGGKGGYKGIDGEMNLPCSPLAFGLSMEMRRLFHSTPALIHCQTGQGGEEIILTGTDLNCLSSCTSSLSRFHPDAFEPVAELRANPGLLKAPGVPFQALGMRG